MKFCNKKNINETRGGHKNTKKFKKIESNQINNRNWSFKLDRKEYDVQLLFGIVYYWVIENGHLL